jgi:hypothetical protein
MKNRHTLKTETEETEIPLLSGGKLKIRKARSGIVQFSTFFQDITDAANKKIIFEDRIGLDWQGFSELMDDHGQSEICGILHPLGLYILSGDKRSKLLVDIESKIAKSGWDNLQVFLTKLRNEHRDDSAIDAFIVAAWVQLFEEPFQEVWLAAMASHAYVAKGDDFAFGYLIALLDQKKNSEGHFLRGKQTLRSASQGGMAKSSATRPETLRTFAELSRLVSSGQSLARASELAFKNGFGTSAIANRKLWNRNRKK